MKNKNKVKKIPIIIIYETINESEVLIEIKKNFKDFKLGNNYIINVELLEITTENIWNNL